MIKNLLKESIVSKLRQIPDYEEEEELEEVDNDTFRQMYQGGLSKSEMEKSATRKFTARSPRVESRAKPIEEVIQPQPSSDEIVPSDDELEKIEQENSEIDMMNDVESSEVAEEPTSLSEPMNVSEVEETEINTIEAEEVSESIDTVPETETAVQEENDTKE